MTKERLRQYKHIKKEIAHIKLQLEEVETALYSPRSQRMDGMPRNPSGGGDPIDLRLLEKHAALMNRYRVKLADLIEEQLAVEDAIENLDSTARRLLRYRYLDGLTWEEVCVAMSYSWRQVHRLHAEALQKLKEDRTCPQ